MTNIRYGCETAWHLHKFSLIPKKEYICVDEDKSFDAQWCSLSLITPGTPLIMRCYILQQIESKLFRFSGKTIIQLLQWTHFFTATLTFILVLVQS